MTNADDITAPAPATLQAEAVSREDVPELAARLRLVVNRLARHMRSQGPADLSPSLASALVTIELHGPITLGGLAALEGVTPPSITRMITTLEQRGLVGRETDPDDRRIAHVSLTPEGRRSVQRTRTRKTAYLTKRLGRLSDADIAALRQALPLLEGILEDDR